MSHQCLLVTIVVFITTEALSGHHHGEHETDEDDLTDEIHTNIDEDEEEEKKVSTETCGKDLLVGTSCIIKLTTRNKEKPPVIRWIHDTHGIVLRWKGGEIKEQAEGVSMEEDGSLRFSSVSLKDTGRYIFNTFNAAGAELGRGEVEIKVYEKAPKPAVKSNCTKYGNVTLTCDIGEREDLTLSWYKEDKIIQNENKPQVFLSSTQVQENKPYSCEAHNPVSKEKSDSVPVSCGVVLRWRDYWRLADDEAQKTEEDETVRREGLNREFVIWISIVLICLVFILLFLFIPPLYGSCAARCGRQKTSRK